MPFLTVGRQSWGVLTPAPLLTGADGSRLQTGVDRGVRSMLLGSVCVFLPAAVSFILRRALCTEVSISVLLRGESKRPFD